MDPTQSISEFARLVKEMRVAQARFFADRSLPNLDAAKSLERKVDHTVRDVLDKQGKLFA